MSNPCDFLIQIRWAPGKRAFVLGRIEHRCIAVSFIVLNELCIPLVCQDGTAKELQVLATAALDFAIQHGRNDGLKMVIDPRDRREDFISLVVAAGYAVEDLLDQLDRKFQDGDGFPAAWD
jgi:hypothetical protein